MNKDKYQESLNDIIRNCKGFPCKNDSFYNMQELVDNSYIEYLGIEQKNKELQERIDKAIEYIKERFYFNEETGEYSLLHTIDKDNIKEVLDILKGEQNER